MTPVAFGQQTETHVRFGMKPDKSLPPTEVDMSWVDKGTYGPAPGKVIRVFILTGQSNMVGRGESRELPKETRRGNDRVLMFEDSRWQPLRPVSLNFGPEISFGATIAEAWPDETIGIIKLAIDGTGVLAWHPQWSFIQAERTHDGHKGSLHEEIVKVVQAATEAQPIELEGIIWVQGGTDMGDADLGKEYLENLSDVVTGFRKAFVKPELPFVLGSWRSNLPDDLTSVRGDFKPKRPGAYDVMQAQYTIQHVLPGVRMVPLRGLTLHPDGVHYDTLGQLRLGRLLAGGFLELSNIKDK